MNRIWAQVILENEKWATKARQELNGFFLIPKTANDDKSKGKPIRICKYESKYSPNNNLNNKNIDSKRNLLVTNLDAKMTQMEFYNIFIKYGDISSGKIEYDENGISKGYGYIYYYDESSAEKAKGYFPTKLIEYIVFSSQFSKENFSLIFSFLYIFELSISIFY